VRLGDSRVEPRRAVNYNILGARWNQLGFQHRTRPNSAR